MSVSQSSNKQKISVFRLTLLGILGNLCLAIIKGIAGILGHSYALTADAIESMTDVFSSTLLLIGLWYARLPPDDNHPYGHGRAESLATFIIVAFLLGSATVIVFESIKHIRTPHKIPAPFTLLVLIVVVISKEGFYQLFSRKSQQTQSSALHAEAWHHRADALTSIAAFIGISLALVMGEGWESADDWAALFAATIIYINAYRIFRPTLGEIMDEDTHEHLRHSITAIAEREARICGVSDCLARKTGSEYIIDLQLDVPRNLTVAQTCAINSAVKAAIRHKHSNISRIFIEITCRAAACEDCPHQHKMVLIDNLTLPPKNLERSKISSDLID